VQAYVPTSTDEPVASTSSSSTSSVQQQQQPEIHVHVHVSAPNSYTFNAPVSNAQFGNENNMRYNADSQPQMVCHPADRHHLTRYAFIIFYLGLDRYRVGTRYPILLAAAILIPIPGCTNFFTENAILWGV